MSIVNGVVRVRADGRRRLRPPTQTILADAKWRQANKINEIRNALIDAGRVALDEQAKALGLRRSPTWDSHVFGLWGADAIATIDHSQN